MSAYITTDFTSPKAIHTACTDSSTHFNVLLIYLFCFFFCFVAFLYFFLASQQNHTHSICFSKMQQTINIEME